MPETGQTISHCKIVERLGEDGISSVACTPVSHIRTGPLAGNP
jgi:hypothetical protein